MGNAGQFNEEMAQAGGLESLDVIEPEVVEAVPIGALAAIEQGQISSQVATARAYPRSLKRFISELGAFATISQPIALSCQFSMPRDGKRIVGPSIRFAELVAAAYGNLRCESIVAEPGERSITAYGTCLDLEKNLGVRVSVSRRITRRDGSRYGDDMIQTTSQAGVSIAMRNAILRVVPRALWSAAYEAAQQVAIGGSGSFEDRRTKAFEYLAALGCEQATILAHLGRERIEEVVLDDVLLMRTVASEIKSGQLRPEDAFPPVQARATSETKARAASGAQAALDAKPESRPAASGNGAAKPASRAAVPAPVASAKPDLEQAQAPKEAPEQTGWSL